MIRERSKGKNLYPCFPNVGYKQANNYQYWIHWNLLSDCRTDKYVIGLYCSIMNQWRKEFHVSAVNKIYEDWNRSHGPLVAICGWIMLRCAMCTKHFGQVWYQETDAGICFKKSFIQTRLTVKSKECRSAVANWKHTNVARFDFLPRDAMHPRY